MEININIPGFLSSERKILKIKNFELSILKNDDKKNVIIEETTCHIKYITLKDRNGVKITIERKDINEKFQIKTDNPQDMENLMSTVNKEQEKYKSFIKEYYEDNNSYNLIEGDSFMDYFSKIKEFLLTFDSNLENMKMNQELDKLIELIKSLLEKIDYYIEEINKNENSIKEKSEELYGEGKEIKELLINLKESVNNYIFGLNKTDINNSIDNFKDIVKQKSREVNLLIDEIKYNLVNYLALKDEKTKNKNEIFETKEEEYTKALLENESLKIQNENLNIENQILSQYLFENKNKK